MNTLTFNDVDFNLVEKHGQIWLTSSDVAKALGYKSARSITNLYNANSDEFSSTMTEVIESVTSLKTKGLRAKIRIFSLRGCHLLAMFARTKIAKEFRRWVLDILDREVKTTSIQRTPLRKACDRLAVGNMLISDAYKVVTSHYDVEHIDQIPESKLPEAVAFVYEMVLIHQKPTTAMDNDTLMENRMWKDVGFRKTEEVMIRTEELSSLLKWVSQKVEQINAAHSTIFDGFNEQKWYGLTPEQLELAKKKSKHFL